MNHPDDAHELDVWRQLHDHPVLMSEIGEFDGAALQLQTQLRDKYPAEVVRKGLLLAELRERAASRFSRADRMWFDRTGCEQATPEEVARHKALRFSGSIADLCCGIGGDTLALATRGDVTAVDRSPLACQFTEWNADVYEVGSHVHTRCMDVAEAVGIADFIHIDPDRRPGGGRRVIRVEEASPDLETLRVLMPRFRGGAVKLSPAANFFDKFPGTELELVSLHGECKEATIWFGELAEPHVFRATLLPGGETLAGDPLAAFATRSPLGAYIYDPDPAVVRAGLVDLLAESTGLSRLDDEEEYLTSETLVVTPFGRPFEVLEITGNNPRDYRRAVGKAGFGQVEIKCRHVPIDAQKIRRKLPLTGDIPGVLIFARVAGRTQAVICRRLGETSA